MKLALLSESPADEAAIRILVQAVLGTVVEWVPPARARPGGCGSVLQRLAADVTHFHYRTDAEGLVVVVDSDDTPAHAPAHAGRPDPACRMCMLLECVAAVQRTLSPRFVAYPVRCAVGLAVPAIEAWYRCGADVHATEAAFVRELQAKGSLYSIRNRLKQQTYGTDRPPMPLETEVAIREATRLAQSLDLLERCFPSGFGELARTLRQWLA